MTYLGAHAAEGIHRSFGEALTTVDVVTPVPLYWRRRIARGYNQAAEISRPLAERIARPHRLLLRRSRSTRRQATLPRDERLSNPAGAFAPRQRERIAGLNVLLVDDVVTTGATVGAAARALRDAGAESVTVAALARTSPPEAGERRFWQGS